MMVVPTNLEWMAVNMMVVMIMFMARVGWNTNLCGALKGSGEEDGTSLQGGGPRRTKEDHGRPSLPQVASLPPYHLPWTPMALTRSIHPAKKTKESTKYNHKDICFPGVVFGSASSDGVLPNWPSDIFLIFSHLSQNLKQICLIHFLIAKCMFLHFDFLLSVRLTGKTCRKMTLIGIFFRKLLLTK